MCIVDDQSISEVTKAHLPNHKIFVPSNEHQRGLLIFTLLLLFVPFQDESDLIAESEMADVAFNRHIGGNVDLLEHHENLQALLKAQTAVKIINEVQDAPAPAAEEDAFFQGEAKGTLKDVLMNVHRGQKPFTIALQSSIQICKNVNDHLSYQTHHENAHVRVLTVSPCACLYVRLVEQESPS